MDMAFLLKVAGPMIAPLEPLIARGPEWLDELELIESTAYTIPTDAAERTLADDLAVLVGLGGVARIVRGLCDELEQVEGLPVSEIAERAQVIYRVLYLASGTLSRRLQSFETPAPVSDATITPHLQTGVGLTSSDLEELD